MPRMSFVTSPSGTSLRRLTPRALTVAAVACAFAVSASVRADAQTHRGAVQHAHGAAAHALKAACSTHAKHAGSHSCSPAKAHKHRAKAQAHRKHAPGALLHAPVQEGKVPTSSSTPDGSPGATCSDGLDATLDEEGSFACVNGAEPGCQEGFAPVVAGDGSTLICEPEADEAGEEEAG